jgi:F-type H+-transporting ATPase subunit a
MTGLNISLAAEAVGHIGSFPITNAMLGSLLAAGTLIVLARTLARRINPVPGKMQSAAELVVEFLLNLMDGVTGDRAKTKRFFPIVGTIFLFIVTMNWLGLMPFFGTIGVREIVEGQSRLIPIFRGGSADLNMTVAIAMVSVIAAQVFGVIYVGAKKHLRKYFNPNPTFTFVGIIEFISEFTKVISFSFRLFGNIFAGEVLLLVISSLVPLIAPLPFYFLEIFVGLIQAFVFALLTLVFFTIASTEHEEAHDKSAVATANH